MIEPENSSEQYETPNIDNLPLPSRGRLTVPSQAISLVNRSIKAAYPQLYKRDIPLLTEKDVRICSKSQMDSFDELMLSAQAHPLALACQAARNQHFGISAGSLNVSMKTISERFDRPILITDTFFQSLVPFGELTLSEVLAFMLIHENLHRVGGQRDLVINTEEPIYTGVALAVRTSEIHFTANKNKSFLQDQLDIIDEYASSHTALLRVDGALAQLYSPDEEDGQMKRLLDNGYDLNEALVEFISEGPRKKLFELIYKNHHPLEAAELVEVLNDNQNKTATMYAVRIPRDILMDYCRDLGLATEEEIVQSYLQGEYPLLHAQRLPNEIYL